PVIGASGAIAVLMGGYLALFPSSKMRMIVFLGVYKRFSLPAWTFLLYWSALQIISLALGESATDGVAYAVHVGGFAVGAMTAIIWKVSYPFAEERLSAFIRDGHAQADGWRKANRLEKPNRDTAASK
ncbi:MAG TPA: rhomboid family intramembrane serine protease, partial [Rhizomicrobium sp.]